MQAYKTHQNIPPDRHGTLTLPPDFPVGEAEIIVLAHTEPGTCTPARFVAGILPQTGFIRPSSPQQEGDRP